MISGSEIYDIVTSDIPLADKTATLVRFANNAGGLDNITVALVSMNEEDAEWSKIGKIFAGTLSDCETELAEEAWQMSIWPRI